MTTHAPAAAPALDPAAPVTSGRGPDHPGRDPRWVRAALGLLLLTTAVTYLWNLSASGFANTFYAAAVEAGTRSWKAWLFGALDAPASITVDKPPASLWVMTLSARVFGFSSWSLLAPQALMGVAAVALTYATVRRWSGPRTALAAAAILASTPVAVLMFRFDNPDALLVLCLVAAAYTTVRAVDAHPATALRWMAATGAVLGLGFLTKMLQVALAVPALAVVYLVVASGPRRRILEIAAALVAFDVAVGWYVTLVALWPAGSRPFIGGTWTNSPLELAVGYNGIGRIIGNVSPESPPVSPGTLGYPGFGGTPGAGRMVGVEFSGQVSWLLPAALVLLVAGLWILRRSPRGDRRRGLLLLGGTWTLVHALVFSTMNGTIHPYYSVAMAPGIAVTVASGASILWRRRRDAGCRVLLATVLVGTAAWSAVVLRQHDWGVPIGIVVIVAAAVAGVVTLGRSPGPAALVVAAGLGLLGTLGAPTAFAAVTASVPHHGTMPCAGPVGTFEVVGDDVDPTLASLLRSAGTTWSSAVLTAKASAPLALASGTSVLPVGGFDGSDPSPTLASFQQAVRAGHVRYFVAGPFVRTPPSPDRPVPDVSTEIGTWVAANYASSDVGGRQVFDLLRPDRGSN